MFYHIKTFSGVFEKLLQSRKKKISVFLIFRSICGRSEKNFGQSTLTLH